MTLHATPPGINREIDALRKENAALKAELAARPNYGTASNHSVWALQRDRIKELEARARAYERHLAEVHGCTCDEVDPDALEVLAKKEAP
jgi:hypothetical protein